MLPVSLREGCPTIFRRLRALVLGLTVVSLPLAGSYGLLAQNDVSLGRAARGFSQYGSRDSDPRYGEKSPERKREGTKIIDELGTFQNAGDRLAFLPAGDKESYRVLENLALERVDRALDETRGQRQWVVSGVLTEFRGANYLLLTKAVIRLEEGDTALGQ